MNLTNNHRPVLLLEIECRWCGTRFCLCRRCWRGQVYCCEKCRKTAKRQAHQEAQRRYRRTERGRKAHREAEKRRRVGLCKESQEIVDDTGTTPPVRGLTLHYGSLKACSEWAFASGYRVGRCQVCGSWGIIVERFPRRGYGKRSRWEYEGS